MQSIRVVIPDPAAVKLAELAERKYRSPRQQAAILVLAGLERAERELSQRPDAGTESGLAAPDRSSPPSAPEPPTDALDGAG